MFTYIFIGCIFSFSSILTAVISEISLRPFQIRLISRLITPIVIKMHQQVIFYKISTFYRFDSSWCFGGILMAKLVACKQLLSSPVCPALCPHMSHLTTTQSEKHYSHCLSDVSVLPQVLFLLVFLFYMCLQVFPVEQLQPEPNV